MEVRNLNVEGLAGHLKGHLPDDLIQILKNHRINGVRFMNLNQSALKLFNFDLAHILDITNLIDEIKSGITVLTSPSVVVSATVTATHTPTSSDVLEAAGATITATHTPKSDDESGSGDDSDKSDDGDDDQCEETVEANKTLEKHVSASYLENLTPYERRGLRAKCLNWNRLNKQGLSLASTPCLPVPIEHLLIKPKNKEIPSKSGKPAKKGSKISNNNTESVQEPVRHSRRILSLQSSNKRDRQSLNDSSDLTDSEIPTPDPEIAGPSRTRNEEQLFFDDSDDVGSGDEREKDKENIEELRYKLPTPPPLDKEEISKLQPQLPKFDVVSILSQYDSTKVYISHLEEGYLFIDKKRKLIMRTLVKHICYKHFNHPSQFNKLHREGLSKSLVVTFPQFQKIVPVESKEPWSHITGNVNNVVKRIMSALPDSERPRKSKKSNKKKKFKVCKTVDPKVLAILNPDRTNRDEIIHGMKQRFPNRERDRHEGKSITELLLLWPHFNHYEGEIISLEFSLMKPDAKDMAVLMTSLVPKIVTNWKDNRVKPICKDDTMRAFLLLAAKLPHSIGKNNTAVPQEKEILELITVGNIIEDFVEQKRVSRRTSVQPYLIGYASSLTKDVLKYYLVLDSKIMELGAVPLIRAIDWLFKSYVVFNVHYPKTWRMLFRFIQTCFYKIFFGANDDVPPSCQQILTELMSW